MFSATGIVDYPDRQFNHIPLQAGCEAVGPRRLVGMATGTKAMQGKHAIWLLWLLVLLSYAVPYTLLRDVHAWYGSFLFWTLVGLLVIAVNVVMTRRF